MASKGGRGKDKRSRQRGQENRQFTKGLEKDDFQRDDEEAEGFEESEEGTVNCRNADNLHTFYIYVRKTCP